MRRTAGNLMYHELIGLEVEVTAHSDPGLVGVKGVVVWETRKMLFVKVRDRILKIPKLHASFRFFLPSGIAVELDGLSIFGRPDERLKRARGRFRW